METLEQIRPTAVTVVLARRGTGKTYLIGSLIHKWLQQKRMQHQSIILFSSTANASDDFSFLPDEYKHVYADELLLKVMAFQKKRIQLQKRRAKASKQNSCVLSGLTIIMDDVFSSSANAKSIMHSKPIIQLFTQSRHWKISCFFLVQYPKFLMSPLARSQIQYLLVSNLSEESTRIAYSLTTGKPWNDFKREVAALDAHEFLMFDGVKKESGDARWSKVVAPPDFTGRFLVRHAKAVSRKQQQQQKSDKDDSGGVDFKKDDRNKQKNK